MDQNPYQSYQPYEPVPPVTKNAAYYRAKAREVLKPCYWYAVLAALIASLLGGVTSGVSVNVNFNFGSGNSSETNVQLDSFLHEFEENGFAAFEEVMPFLIIFISIFAVAMLFALLLYLFVGAPVALGYQRYNLHVVDGEGKKLDVLFRYFKVGYLKSVGARLLYDLILAACALPLAAVSGLLLWGNRGAIMSLFRGDATPWAWASLALISLVIFAVSLLTALLQTWLKYRYAFCFMILAEYPELSVVDAFRNSASLMRGKKWRFFCLQLSFLGWILLATFCTCGIGAIFLTPYREAANAAFYDEITNRTAAKETEFPSLNPDDYSPDNARW